MSLDTHVQTTLTISNSGVAMAGFGLIGVLTYKSVFPERLRLYSKASAMITDGFAATSPEVRAVNRILSQSPRATKVAVIRGELAPTQKYRIDVADVRNEFLYQIKVKGEGITDATISYESDADATADEIAAGLVAELNAVVGKNYLAAVVVEASDADYVEVTGAAPGNWFSLEVVDRDALSIKQTHADPGVATDLAAIAVADSSWYYLYTLFNSDAVVLAAAEWVEANGKMYYPDVCNTDCETAIGAGDVGEEIEGLGYKRTVLLYHINPAAMAGAALMGRLAPLNPGKWTAAYKPLVGVQAMTFTDTQFANLDARKMTYYKTEAGRDITWEGKVANAEYGFADVVTSLDWFLDTLRKRVFGVFVAKDKVSYTDEDIAEIKGAAEGVVLLAMSDAHNIVAPGTPGDPNDPVPTVSFPRVRDIDPGVRALRKVPDGIVSFRLQGAAHSVLFDVTLTF